MTATAGGACHRRRAEGVELLVRLTPKSARDAVEGVATAADGRAHLKARVRAVPEKGKANRALVALLANALGLPAGAIEIVSGDTARLKTVLLKGDAEAIEAAIAAAAGRGSP